MAFLGNLLSAGISSGLIPNLLQGAGSVVGDIVGGLQRGEKLTPGLVGSALAKGAAGTVGRILAPKPTAEQPIRVSAPVGNTAGNARPVIVQDGGIGMSRVHVPAPAPSVDQDMLKEERAAVDSMSKRRNAKGLALFWRNSHASSNPAKREAADYAASELKELVGYRHGQTDQEIVDKALAAAALKDDAANEAMEKKAAKKFRNYYADGGRPSKKERRAMRG